jgi:hypothetical protein
MMMIVMRRTRQRPQLGLRDEAQRGRGRRRMMGRQQLQPGLRDDAQRGKRRRRRRR